MVNACLHTTSRPWDFLDRNGNSSFAVPSAVVVSPIKQINQRLGTVGEERGGGVARGGGGGGELASAAVWSMVSFPGWTEGNVRSNEAEESVTEDVNC